MPIVGFRQPQDSHCLDHLGMFHVCVLFNLIKQSLSCIKCCTQSLSYLAVTCWFCGHFVKSGGCKRLLETEGYRICDQAVSKKGFHPPIFLVLLVVLVHRSGNRRPGTSNLGSVSQLRAVAPRPNKLGSPIHHQSSTILSAYVNYFYFDTCNLTIG